MALPLAVVALCAAWADDDPAHQRAVRLVAQMTLKEKLGMLQGNSDKKNCVCCAVSIR